MPAPAVLGALISGGAQLASGLFGIGKGRREFKRNKQLMQHELSLNKQMFDYQNAYNLPKNQMNRLKEAGLNPALMYGQGTTGNASQAPQTRYSPYQEHTADFTGAIQGAATMAQNVLQKQQVDNLEAQKKETDSRTLLNSIDAAVKGGTKEEAKGLVRYQLENLKSDNKNKLQNLTNLKLSEKMLNKGLTHKQLEIENQQIKNAMSKMDKAWMKKSGLSNMDSTIIKTIWRASQQTKIAFPQLLEKIFGKVTPFGVFKK